MDNSEQIKYYFKILIYTYKFRKDEHQLVPPKKMYIATNTGTREITPFYPDKR